MPTFPENPEDRWKSIVYGPTDTMSDPASRDPKLVDLIVHALGLTTNARYLPKGGATYCKTAAEDVMLGMKVVFPHWVDPVTGAPASPGGKSIELNINAGVDWLHMHGQNYGWEECSSEEATAAANLGQPVLAVWKNPSGGHGHVGAVLSSISIVVQIAQAGMHNFERGPITHGFGAVTPEVHFFKNS